jgi:nucleoside 2-deoxyribosyltransferase
MKVYIAGKITGLDNYKELFAAKEKELTGLGYSVINPAILPIGFEHHEYMHICYSMIDVCDMVVFLDNWSDSVGAKLEMAYAFKLGKAVWLDVFAEEMEKKLLEGDSPSVKCTGLFGRT